MRRKPASEPQRSTPHTPGENRRVTRASRMLDNFISPYSAMAVEKILAEDGLIIGKTNLNEFALGSST